MAQRKQIAKTQTATAPRRTTSKSSRLMDMPQRTRAAKSFVVMQKGGVAFLQLNNLEEPLVWKLALGRTAKADPEAMANDLGPLGSADLNTLLAPNDVAAEPAAAPPSTGTAVQGTTEFGLQTADDHEYFLSKFGDLAGVVRIRRKEGSNAWSAQLSKTNVPRVLTPEAVQAGLMPPDGQSALPKTIEAVVPEEFAFWKASGEQARTMRDALVESGFLTEDTTKVVDGEIRKVEVKFFVYEPGQDMGKSIRKAARPTLADRLFSVVPDTLIAKAFTPMAEDGDWLETLDATDGEGTLAILSPTGTTSAREMARAVATCKGEFLLEHADTPETRAAFRETGVTFKLSNHDDRIFCSSFAPLLSPSLAWVEREENPARVHAFKEASFEEIRSAVTSAIREQRKPPADPNADPEGCCGPYVYVSDIWPDRAVYSVEGGASRKSTFMMEHYSYANGVVTLANDGVEVRQAWEPVTGAQTAEAPPAAEPASETMEMRAFKVAKAEPVAGEERYVLGIVLEPDIIDSQNDTYNEAAVRTAAEDFMENHGNVGFMHKGFINDKVKIIESYVTPVAMKIGELDVRKGTWMMAVRVLDDELWTSVKDGSLTGFSIGGTALRSPLDQSA